MAYETPHESEFRDADFGPDDEPVELERAETARRILFTLVLYVFANVAQAVLTIIVLFQLGFALITQRAPGTELRRFANQTISYLVRIGRFVSYNDSRPPFPFREFPTELDLDVPLDQADPT